MNLVEQVRATLAAHAPVASGDTVVAGVSGGPDSLALVHVLAGLARSLGFGLHVAHLNHQLRGAASDADAEFVARIAREWDLPVTVGARDVGALAREQHLSLEQAARNARYAFLVEVAERAGAGVIAVAHNADDQVETVLMHFLRGAGPAGLRGMPYRAPLAHYQSPVTNYDLPITLVRPLLDIPRRDIEAYCREHGLAPRVDASNADTTFFRNRLRHEVLPYLETLNPNIRAILLRTCRVVAEDYEFLSDEVAQVYGRLATEADGTVAFPLPEWRDLPVALQRGTLRAAVRTLRSDLRDFNWEHVETARETALNKATGAVATLPRGLALVVEYANIVIGPARLLHGRGVPVSRLVPQLNVDRLVVDVPGKTRLPDSDWYWLAAYTPEREHLPWWQDRTALLDADACRGELVLRRRRPGDRFQPAGMGGHTKSLQEFMVDAKVPRLERDRLPLLALDDRIVWVCGWRVDERARVTAQTREILKVGLRLGQNEFL